MPVGARWRHFTAFTAAGGGAACWNVLPMGLAWSPYLFDLALRPLDVLWRVMGLRVIRYVDDLLVLAPGPDALIQATQLVMGSLTAAGWRLSAKKSFIHAYTSVDFLGVSVCLPLRSASVAPRLAAKLHRQFAALRQTGRWSLREAQGLAGRLAFAALICTPLASYRRAVDELVVQWPLEVTPVHRLVLPPNVKAVMMEVEHAVYRTAARWWPMAGNGRVWSCFLDASATGVGLRIQSPDGAVTRRALPLSRADVPTGSAVRELEALIALVAAISGQVRAGDEVVAHMDALVVVSVLANGTARATDLVAKMRTLFHLLCSAPPFLLRVVHVPREDNAEADSLSRASGWEESALGLRLRLTLFRWAFGENVAPDVDLFATASNTVATHYYTRFFDSRAAGQDGLAAPRWTGGVYAFPPFPLAARARAVFESYRDDSRVQLLLVIPRDEADKLEVAPAQCWLLPPLCVSPPPYDRLCISPRRLVALISAPPRVPSRTFISNSPSPL